MPRHFTFGTTQTPLFPMTLSLWWETAVRDSNMKLRTIIIIIVKPYKIWFNTVRFQNIFYRCYIYLVWSNKKESRYPWTINKFKIISFYFFIYLQFSVKILKTLTALLFIANNNLHKTEKIWYRNENGDWGNWSCLSYLLTELGTNSWANQANSFPNMYAITLDCIEVLISFLFWGQGNNRKYLPSTTTYSLFLNVRFGHILPFAIDFLPHLIDYRFLCLITEMSNFSDSKSLPFSLKYSSFLYALSLSFLRILL